MKAKILLVDDNAAFIDSIRDILEDEGYEVETAHSGEAAVELTRAFTFDLVLMDIKMPGMNGVECFLQMQVQNPDVRVLLFTAYALDDLIAEAHDNGVVAVLKKPLNMAEFLGAIEGARRRDENACILVADDDPYLRDNLRETLTESGYRVFVARDGRETIQKAEVHSFDILLLDMKMPKLNGLQVYQHMKGLQPNMVTILITGYAEEMKTLIGQALRENAKTVLPKPLDMQRLLHLLEAVTEAKRC